MDRQVNHVCEQHPDQFECPDQAVGYLAKFDEYAIGLDDGTVLVINYCPWCGRKLPESKRNLWHQQLEDQGIDPWWEEVPAEYQTDAWWRKQDI